MKQFSITGMSCAACSARIEKAVSKLDGVSSCSVNLLTNSMIVEGDATPRAIIDAVEKAGYGASLADKSENDKKNKSDDSSLKNKDVAVLRNRFIASLVFLLALMYISMGQMLLNFPLPSFLSDNCLALALLQLLLTTVIMVINQKFFISGFKGLIHRAPNMDTLVSLGASAAFGYSTVMIFAMTAAQSRGDLMAVMEYMNDLYFESAAMILTLITLGKLLEAFSKGKTTNALKGLMQLAPKTANIVKDGVEISVEIEKVRKGDIFVVRPGENIPVDGVVIDGGGAVDESSLTGESIPVDKASGDTVSAGTLNQSGFIRCEATRVGEDTTLSQIIQMVSDAAATKAPIAKIADKVSGIFVPVVMSIALLTFVIWLLIGYPISFSLARGISVLVISCPCALGLATPVAIMVGNGVGAKHGILFKTASSLEITGKARVVAFDKTGTITLGRPEVTDILPCDGIDPSELLLTAYSLERKSEHPLASAICAYAEKENAISLDVSEFEALPGNGLCAVFEGETLSGGNYIFISKNTDIPDKMRTISEGLSETGKTPLFFSRGGKLLGIIAVADVIKQSSIRAIAELHDMGIKVVMLTGDNERTAMAIGKQVGVDEVIAGVLPNEKEKVIRSLKDKGVVVMVGDGINDAPALTGADIGIAIGAGTDVAIDAADIVLMKNDLTDVPAAIRLSRATLRNIRENLFWAFIYNIIGIPLAAGVFIPLLNWEMNPMYGAAAMSLSSFFVVSNALRLNLFKLYKNKVPKQAEKIKSNIKEKKMKKTLNIQGMMCGHCEARVKKALEAIDGVESATVSHEKGNAEVVLTKDVSDELLKKAVEAQDYTVTGIK